MTFEEYKQALADNTGFMAERGQDLDKDKIYVGDKNSWQSLVVLNLTQNNIESIIGSVLKDYPPSDIAYLFDKTNKFLSTPYEKRKLEPIYQLVWDINSRGQWVLGYDHDLWEIGKADALEKQGYQVNFTDEELVKLTNNLDLANRINVLKRRVNYK